LPCSVNVRAGDLRRPPPRSPAHPGCPEGHLLSVGVVTYGGGAHFGIYADPESIVELDELPGLLTGELARLERVRRHGGSRRAAATARAHA